MSEEPRLHKKPIANKFSAEVARLIVERKRSGASNIEASAAADVTPQSLYNWFRRGKSGEEPYASFLKGFKHAEAQARNDKAASIIRDFEETSGKKLVPPSELLKKSDSQ